MTMATASTAKMIQGCRLVIAINDWNRVLDSAQTAYDNVRRKLGVVGFVILAGAVVARYSWQPGTVTAPVVQPGP